ncbi:MAG: hypothetical protein WA810_16130 [Maribacter sp.]
MILSCQNAVSICNKAQYGEASQWDLIQLRFHKFICKTCVKHSQKNTKLTVLCNKAKLVSLSEVEKSRMKQVLTEKE